jgi:hypothetical protein
MEILIRIANDKYLKSGVCLTWAEAVKKLLEEDFY